MKHEHHFTEQVQPETVLAIDSRRNREISDIRARYERKWNWLVADMQAEIDAAERRYRRAMQRNLEGVA